MEKMLLTLFVFLVFLIFFFSAVEEPVKTVFQSVKSLLSKLFSSFKNFIEGLKIEVAKIVSQ